MRVLAWKSVEGSCQTGTDAHEAAVVLRRNARPGAAIAGKEPLQGPTQTTCRSGVWTPRLRVANVGTHACIQVKKLEVIRVFAYRGYNGHTTSSGRPNLYQPEHVLTWTP
jgi:hypothetical protein